jgi:choline dehydrogenase
VPDFIVVGAGSAGSVIASRLSADPAVQVLLLEAGGAKAPRESSIPAGFSKLFRTRYDWDLRTAPEPALLGRSLYWPRGRLLGGSSAINAQIWTPPARADLDGWQALGNDGWSWTEMAPYLARAERLDPAVGGGSVGIPVSRPRTVNPVTTAFLGAARSRGIAPNDGVRDGELDGVGLFRLTQTRGARISAATGYLTPVRHRPNLRILPHATVDRIRFEGRRAVGVDYRLAGTPAQLTAAGRVVLAAGAVGSPRLLLLSGIGPTAQLESIGIGVVADLPGVGRNLQDHLACAVMHWCREPISLATAERLDHLLRYLVLRRGPLTSNVAEAGAFVRLAPAADRPDVELLFAPSFFVDHGFGNPAGHGFTIATVLLAPESRGTLSLGSADPDRQPVIQPNYLTEPGDLERLTGALELARRVAAAGALDRYRGPELFPGSGTDLTRFIRSKAETLYHPVGTCRMGADTDSVVSPRLAVHGFDDLWVADASIMPTITRSHTHAPTVMIGERAAELLVR